MIENNTNKYKELLEVGQVFKNYKDLCNHLGEEIKKSNSRIAHLKKWKRSFEFRNEGHKIIIEDIFKETKEREGNWKGGDNAVKYIDIIEALLLDMLSQQEGDHLFVSKGNLLQMLKMINSNYGKCKFRMNRLSKEIGIDALDIKDFYSTSDSVLQNNLETALNRLKDKSLIIWGKVMTVGVVDSSIDTEKREITDKYGDRTTEFHLVNPRKFIMHRRATRQEELAILRTERNVMLEWGYEDKHSLFLDGKRNSYYEEVKNILFDRYGIYLYYSSYEFSFNEDHVQDESEKQSYKLQEYLRMLSQRELNEGVSERLKNNAKNRHKNATLKILEVNKRKYKMRASFDYLENFDKLIEILVDIDFK